MKFEITDDFGSAKTTIGKTGNSLEVKRLDADEFVVLLHTGDCPYELGIYTKEELSTLWKILSSNK